MNDDRKKGSEENDKELSLGSALDEIGLACLGRRVIIGQRAERKPLVVRIKGPAKSPFRRE
jgi:hypothetical protein